MFIWREKYEELLREITGLRHDASYHLAEADGSTRLLMRVEDENRRLNKQVENERLRAENAVDELLKLKIMADPVSPHAPSRQRFDTAALDNVFEEEDEDAVKRLQEQIEVEGPASSYAKALEETYE